LHKLIGIRERFFGHRADSGRFCPLNIPEACNMFVYYITGNANKWLPRGTNNLITAVCDNTGSIAKYTLGDSILS
jgi:hypothetical protein